MSSSEEESVTSRDEESDEESNQSEQDNDVDSESEEEEVIIAKPVATKKRKSSGKKAAKDPNRPKRNMSAYFLYSNANRARIQAENPDAKFGDIAKLISAEFKSLTDKEKKKWDKKAVKDKERYLDEMSRYEPPEDDSDSDDSDDGKKKKKKKKKPAKDPNRPKRNMSAFFLFSCAHRAEIKGENPDASFGDLAKLVSQRFNSLSEKERKKWDKKAAKDKIRYQEEMKVYEASH